MSEQTTTEAGAEATPVVIPTALTVHKGNPTDEELAALLLVVAAASGGEGAEPDKPQHGIWASRARNLGVSSLGSRRRSSWSWRAAR